MKRRTFKAGDILVEQSVVVSALFILSSGVLAALQEHGSGESEVLRLAPGDCFGQASVLTGAPTIFKVKALTRAVIYEIAKSDIAPILEARPAIAAELNQIIARRASAGKAWSDKLVVDGQHPDNLSERIADRVKALFRIA